jgi:hypothetical protein
MSRKTDPGKGNPPGPSAMLEEWRDYRQWLISGGKPCRRGWVYHELIDFRVRFWAWLWWWRADQGIVTPTLVSLTLLSSYFFNLQQWTCQIFAMLEAKKAVTLQAECGNGNVPLMFEDLYYVPSFLCNLASPAMSTHRLCYLLTTSQWKTRSVNLILNFPPEALRWLLHHSLLLSRFSYHHHLNILAQPSPNLNTNVVPMMWQTFYQGHHCSAQAVGL